jgi:hypothetical protein
MQKMPWNKTKNVIVEHMELHWLTTLYIEYDVDRLTFVIDSWLLCYIMYMLIYSDKNVIWSLLKLKKNAVVFTKMYKIVMRQGNSICSTVRQYIILNVQSSEPIYHTQCTELWANISYSMYRVVSQYIILNIQSCEPIYHTQCTEFDCNFSSSNPLASTYFYK